MVTYYLYLLLTWQSEDYVAPFTSLLEGIGQGRAWLKIGYPAFNSTVVATLLHGVTFLSLVHTWHSKEHCFFVWKGFVVRQAKVEGAGQLTICPLTPGTSLHLCHKKCEGRQTDLCTHTCGIEYSIYDIVYVCLKFKPSVQIITGITPTLDYRFGLRLLKL